jgi:hypothetical protein
MGLVKFKSETSKPGKSGTIDISKRTREKHLGILIIKTFLSLAIIVGFYYIAFGTSFQIKEILTFIASMIIYCTAGYYIMPKPDYSNLGWLGGLINNPFRISDNFNRILVFIKVILLPGRLISITVYSWITISK